MDPKTKWTRKAVYTGRRIWNGKVVHRFELLPEKREMAFRGIRKIHIGFIYKCSEKNIAVKPERTDDDRIDDPSWDAQDALVDAQNEKARTDRKFAEAAKSKHIKAALEVMKPLFKNLPAWEFEPLIRHLATAARKKK